MRDLTNVSHEQAEANGWKILKPLNCEVVGKAVYDKDGLQIMKSTKRFPVLNVKSSPDGEQNELLGWIYNTSTEIHGGEAGAEVISVAEALVYVPLK